MRPSQQQSALRCPLNDILGSEAGVRVIRELVRHGGALSTARLAHAAGMTRFGVGKTLTLLAVIGVIEKIGSGKSILYRIETQHPLMPAIGALFRAENERVDGIIDAIAKATNDPEIVGAWIYGSFARGEDTIDSDLDIAIATTTRNIPLADNVRSALDQAAEKLFFSPSVVDVDLTDIERLSTGDPWWTNLVKEAIVIKGERPEIVAKHHRIKAHG